jgi:ATP-dependent Clp protease ATP-binding subunit ClpA
MTTNAGASEMAKSAIGFGSSKRTGEDEEALNRLFTPEFRNRLDATIQFAPLPTEVIHQVVQKFVMQLEAQLSERNVTFDLSEPAIAWLATRGYDEKMGARPLSRVIQEHIKKPLANEILFGKLKKGGVVKVGVKKDENGADVLDLEALSEAVPVKPKPEAELVGAEAEAPAKASKSKGKSKAAAAKDEKTAEPSPAKRSSVPKVPKKK